jgi:hypothetical protein
MEALKPFETQPTPCELLTNQQVSRWYGFIVLVISAVIILASIAKAGYHFYQILSGKAPISRLSENSDYDYRAV